MLERSSTRWIDEPQMRNERQEPENEFDLARCCHIWICCDAVRCSYLGKSERKLQTPAERRVGGTSDEIGFIAGLQKP
jgi:hypothetical protein